MGTRLHEGAVSDGGPPGVQGVSFRHLPVGMTAAATGSVQRVQSPGWSHGRASATVDRVTPLARVTNAARLCVAVTATVWCLCAGPARAMVVVNRSFPELVARAEQIVVGT